jgi:hypothetical protein
MDEAQHPGSGVIDAVRRLVDRLTAAKTYLAVLRRRLRRARSRCELSGRRMILLWAQTSDPFGTVRRRDQAFLGTESVGRGRRTAP